MKANHQLNTSASTIQETTKVSDKSGEDQYPTLSSAMFVRETDSKGVLWIGSTHGRVWTCYLCDDQIKVIQVFDIGTMSVSFVLSSHVVKGTRENGAEASANQDTVALLSPLPKKCTTSSVLAYCTEGWFLALSFLHDFLQVLTWFG